MLTALERLGRYAVRLLGAARSAFAGIFVVHRRQRGEGLPVLPKRILEQWRLLAARGITASDYYLFRLYRPEVSWEEKLTFLGGFQQWRWQRQVDPVEYDAVTEDKIVFARYLSSLGIPSPSILAIAGRDAICPGETVLDSEAAFAAWLSRTDEDALFLKPARGITGMAVLAIERSKNHPGRWEPLPKGTPMSPEEVARYVYAQARWLPYIVQKRLRPHESLARLSPDVLHTARIITMLSDRFVPIAAALKIGSGRSPVDNLVRGNLVASIDIATGTLQQAWTVQDGRPAGCSVHPASGATMAGIVVPDWREALALVEHCHRHLYFDGLLGWDIGFTAEGPVVVEANTVFSPIVTQVAADKGLLQTELAAYFRRHGLFAHCGLGF